MRELLVVPVATSYDTAIADEIDKLGYCFVEKIKRFKEGRSVLLVRITDVAAKEVIPEITARYDKN